MELKVESTLFNSNGGGQGGGYHGRQDQGEPRKPKPAPEAQDEPAHLEHDTVALQPNAFRSRLAFWPSTPEPAVDLDALGDELKDRVRYLTLAVGHLERRQDRCTSAAIGSVLIAG